MTTETVRREQAFTDWLAENPAVLGERLGVMLETSPGPHRVGRFKPDLLFTSVGGRDETRVLVENQLGISDHTHLGQIITYAAGLDGVETVVWIAERFRPEHLVAVDGLNRQETNEPRYSCMSMVLDGVDYRERAPVIVEAKVTESSESSDCPWPPKVTGFFEGFESHRATSDRLAGLEFRVAPRADTPAVRTNLGDATERGSGTVELKATLRRGGVHAAGLFVEVLVRSKNANQSRYVDDLLAKRSLVLERGGDSLRVSRTREPIVFVAKRNFNIGDRSSWAEHWAWMEQHLAVFHEVLNPVVEELDRTVGRG